MEERGGAGQHKGAGSCGFALGRWRITGWGGGSKGGHGCGGDWEVGGGETRESESQNGSWGRKMGVKGEKGGCEGETAQHKKAYSWSGLFLRRRGHFRK